MIDICRDYIIALMDDIYYSEISKIHRASDLIKQTLNRGGNICFFGQGHSVWVGRDTLDCYDLPIKVIEEKMLVHKNYWILIILIKKIV